MRNYYRQKPDTFNAQLEVVGVYIIIKNQLLVLKRSINSAEGNSWTVPSGKIEKKETILEAAARELFEETGIETTKYHHLKHFGSVYIQKNSFEYVYHFCELIHDFGLQFPVVQLSDEHQSYKWATVQELTQLEITGGQRMVEEYFYLKNSILAL